MYKKYIAPFVFTVIIIISNLNFELADFEFMYTPRLNVHQYIPNQFLAFLILLYSVYYIDDSPYYIDDIVDLDNYFINDKPFYTDDEVNLQNW